MHMKYLQSLTVSLTNAFLVSLINFLTPSKLVPCKECPSNANTQRPRVIQIQYCVELTKYI